MLYLCCFEVSRQGLGSSSWQGHISSWCWQQLLLLWALQKGQTTQESLPVPARAR